MANQNTCDEQLAADPDIVSDTGPLPGFPHPQTIFLGGLFFMAALTTLRFTGIIILPILLAFILKMVLDPVMRVLQNLGIHRTLAALMLIIIVLSSFIGVGMVLSEPATRWASKLPNGFPELRDRLSFVSKPIENIDGVIKHAEDMTATTGAKQVTVTVQGSRWSDRILTNTGNFISGVGETILVLFFLLIAGDTFLRRLVEILPRFHDKRQAVDISKQTERDISAYLATITLMNALVGISTFIIMKLCGVEDPSLWAIVAFLLNYIPIIGPISCVLLFSLIGMMSEMTLQAALVPAGIYLLVHVVESMAVTPLLVARRFVLNPVLVIISLIFWYWMWGIAGAIISTPLLAITKIICDRIQSLKAFGHFLEGEREVKQTNNN